MKSNTLFRRVAPAAALALVFGALAFSNGRDHGPRSIAGAWINTFQFPGDPNTLVQSQVVTPLDPAGLSFAATVDSPNPAQNVAGHTFGRPTGTYLRVGPNQYKFTLIFARGLEADAFPGRGSYMTLHVFSGAAYLTEEGMLVNDGMLAVFASSQDVAPRDGFPDEGQVPVSVFPWTYESKRVEVQEPYPLP